MCGIIGGFDIPQIEKGLDSIIHRGPDHQKIIQMDNIYFGHVRLSIIDTSSDSNQPFVYGKTTMVFNGTIWNYQELRQKLNIKTKTSGDTEVLCAILDKYGIKGLDMVEGMFAIAFTQGDGSITLVRDRHGEVPLHYSLTGGVFPSFSFCSEIKGLLVLGESGQTIKMLEPGGYIKVTSDYKIAEGLWYNICEHITDTSSWDIFESQIKIGDNIEHGSYERTVSDVPVACLLSGGIDSAITTLIASRHIPNLVTYTAVYNENSKDLRSAREVAKYLGVELREVKVSPPSVDDINDVINTIEMPYKAQVEIGYPCIQLARKIHEDGFKVIMSGEGSDELWASYGMSYHGIKDKGWTNYRIGLFGSQHRKNFSRCNKIFMKYGIECRLPFLNTQLVENSLGLSQEKVWDGKSRPKAIIQEAYRGKLPDDIIDRKKVAFQDGMGIKSLYEDVVENPKKYYLTQYKNKFL
jgi:asparagine synthase (glutamine-hydrolysing)